MNVADKKMLEGAKDRIHYLWHSKRERQAKDLVDRVIILAESLDARVEELEGLLTKIYPVLRRYKRLNTGGSDDAAVLAELARAALEVKDGE